MVFPNPWQRGQAPNGLLNENSRGSGSSYRMPQVLHSNASLKRYRRLSRALESLEDDFAVVFAETNFNRIDQPLPHSGLRFQPVHQNKCGFAEIDIEQRFGIGVFEYLGRPGRFSRSPGV